MTDNLTHEEIVKQHLENVYQERIDRLIDMLDKISELAINKGTNIETLLINNATVIKTLPSKDYIAKNPSILNDLESDLKIIFTILMK